MGHVTMRLGLAMVSLGPLCNKFEVFISTHYEDRKSDAKSRPTKWVCLGSLKVVENNTIR